MKPLQKTPGATGYLITHVPSILSPQLLLQQYKVACGVSACGARAVRTAFILALDIWWGLQFSPAEELTLHLFQVPQG